MEEKLKEEGKSVNKRLYKTDLDVYLMNKD